MSIVDRVSTGSWMLCVVTIARNLLLPLVLFFPFYSFPFLFFFSTKHYFLHIFFCIQLLLSLFFSFIMSKCYNSSFFWHIGGFLFGLLYLCMLHTRSCLTLCNPVDSCPPVSSVHGIFQARIMEWVAISSSGDLAHPGIKPGCPALAGGFFTI